MYLSVGLKPMSKMALSRVAWASRSFVLDLAPAFRRHGAGKVVLGDPAHQRVVERAREQVRVGLDELEAHFVVVLHLGLAAAAEAGSARARRAGLPEHRLDDLLVHVAAQLLVGVDRAVARRLEEFDQHAVGMMTPASCAIAASAASSFS